MSNALFTGCATALITPFKNGAVDYPALGKLLEIQLDAGVDAIIIDTARRHARIRLCLIRTS